MDLDTGNTVNEDELNDLGIKKKNDADIDVDPDALLDPEEVVDPLSEEESNKEEDRGMFGEDAELERYVLDPYEDNKEFN